MAPCYFSSLDRARVIPFLFAATAFALNMTMLAGDSSVFFLPGMSSKKRASQDVKISSPMHLMRQYFGGVYAYVAAALAECARGHFLFFDQHNSCSGSLKRFPRRFLVTGSAFGICATPQL